MASHPREREAQLLAQRVVVPLDREGRFSFRFPRGTRHTLVAWWPEGSSSGTDVDRLAETAIHGRADNVSAGTSELELVLSKP